MFILLFNNKLGAGLLAYTAIRYLTPKQTVIRNGTISAQAQDFGLFTRVECWYDTSFACFPVETYFWKRVNLVTDRETKEYDLEP